MSWLDIVTELLALFIYFPFIDMSGYFPLPFLFFLINISCQPACTVVAVLLYSFPPVLSLSSLSSLRFRRLVTLVVAHDVERVFVFRFHIPSLYSRPSTLTTIHFFLVSSVRHINHLPCRP